MSLLEALDHHYHRLAARRHMPPPGWARHAFGYCIVLGKGGEVVNVEDLHDVGADGKPRARYLQVPASLRRSQDIVANRFWDRCSYVLGVGPADSGRTSREHTAFVELHKMLLADTSAPSLLALSRFVANWRPEHFSRAPFLPAMRASNFVFRLDGDCDADGKPRFVHECEAARAVVERLRHSGGSGESRAQCLVTGAAQTIARLHPTIVGVTGGRSSGSSLVSFNAEAYSSRGKQRGLNAPTSIDAAARYGAALNALLEWEPGKHTHWPLGDTTIVFWTDAENEQLAAELEARWGDWNRFDTLANDQNVRARHLELVLAAQTRTPGPSLPSGEKAVRLHVLGLASNNARLVVRLWAHGDFERFAQRLYRHYDDLAIMPSFSPNPPPLQELVRRTVVPDTIRRNDEGLTDYKSADAFIAEHHATLGVDILRSILAGSHYPAHWLQTMLARIGSGTIAPSGWHAGVARAILVQDARRQGGVAAAPRGFAPESRSLPYRMGRICAILAAQWRSLGQQNDPAFRARLFGAGFARPADVLPRISADITTRAAAVQPTSNLRFLLQLEQSLLAATPLSDCTHLGFPERALALIGYYHQECALRANRQRS